MILAIDPGPRTSGVVHYDPEARRVTYADGSAPLHELLTSLRAWRYVSRSPVLAIERVQAQGQSGADLLVTAEVVGRIWQRALDDGWEDVRLVYRRQVCRALDVTGAGKDAQVRTRMIEMHGGTRGAAVGTRREPGPLYGVTSHAWQALGLAVAVALGGAAVTDVPHRLIQLPGASKEGA